jgi:hypothetical protein
MTEQQEQTQERPSPPVRRREAPIEQEETRPVGAPLQEGVPRKKYRTYSFKIPASVRVVDDDPKVVVLRELGPDEIDEARRIGGSSDRASTEAVKIAIWKVDGVKVDHTEEQATYYWHRWSAKVRHLIQLAWGKIHVTEDSEDDAFLSSMEIGTDA